ncbi:MAG: Yae1 family protein [Kofleriaceae bacterium]
MPSLSHEILVELVRQRGALVRDLLRACAGPLPPEDAVAESASVDLSQVVSAEYRADHVTLFLDPERRPALAVIVEVQRQIDPDKRRTWPVYLTAARASLRCPTMLLVVALDPHVARWARREIPTGHPGFILRPLVISGADVPRVVDAALAQRNPELGVLSVLAHRSADVAAAAVAGIRALPEDLFRLYFDVILTALPEPARHTLEAQMEGYEYQSDFARKYFNQGQQEGREAGRQEGREEGRVDDVLQLARLKLGHVSREDEAAIRAVHDDAKLTALILGLGRARDATEARLVLDELR